MDSMLALAAERARMEDHPLYDSRAVLTSAEPEHARRDFANAARVKVLSAVSRYRDKKKRETVPRTLQIDESPRGTPSPARRGAEGGSARVLRGSKASDSNDDSSSRNEQSDQVRSFGWR